MQRVTGIDLAAKSSNPTGIAVLDVRERRFLAIGHVYTDDEILDVVASTNSSVVVIDAPLSFPPRGAAFRKVELEAIRRGARLLPLTMPAMRILVERAIGLAARLRRLEVSVYETHPWSALRLSGCSFHELLERLRIASIGEGLSKHERDAVIAALVGLCVLEGCAERFEADGDVLFLLKKIC